MFIARIFFFFFSVCGSPAFPSEVQTNLYWKHGYCSLVCPPPETVMDLQTRGWTTTLQRFPHHGFIARACFFSCKTHFYSIHSSLWLLLSVSLLWRIPSPAFLPSQCHDAAFILGQITAAFPPPHSIHVSQGRVYPRLPIASASVLLPDDTHSICCGWFSQPLEWIILLLPACQRNQLESWARERSWELPIQSGSKSPSSKINRGMHWLDKMSTGL